METRNTIIDVIKYLIIATAIIVGVYILTTAFLARNKESEVIQVTGLGSKDFESDLIVWSGAYSQMDVDLKNAYAKLYVDQSKIVKFLKVHNVVESDYVFSAVTINKEYEYTYDKDGNRKSEFIGYSLQQKLTIESKEIAKIEKISREISELINTGVEFYSYEPQYYYTKLSELKKELIEQATENAKERASAIAVKSGFQLGRLKNANMGVFQIIARNSNEDYSWGGTFNTSSKQKTATITMKLRFGIK